MKRVHGFTLVELMIVVATVAILGVCVWYFFTNDGAKTEQADRGVLPGKVNIVCIEGYEYLYVQSRWENYSRAAMAPRFDSEGRPSRCHAEK